MNETKAAQLEQLVSTYWELCGQPSPSDKELTEAVSNLKSALNSGQQVQRTTDKTCQPLYGPRTDIASVND